MMPCSWPWGIIPLREKEYKELLRKADLWDQYAIYDNDKEAEILVKDLIIAYEKLEAVRGYIGILRDQSEKSEDVFERGFCRGIADGLERILEAKDHYETS